MSKEIEKALSQINDMILSVKKDVEEIKNKDFDIDVKIIGKINKQLLSEKIREFINKKSLIKYEQLLQKLKIKNIDILDDNNILVMNFLYVQLEKQLKGK